MMDFRIINVTLSSIFLIILIINNGSTITIDNTIVAGGQDCFERIALGAMLPLEKTFRNDDINSEKKCKELCLSLGEKCQTLSFGLSIRGNGTCQLSSEIIEVVGSRPIGTIFDPNFDLFLRKTNCLTPTPTVENDMPSPITPIDSNRPTTGFGTSSFASDSTSYGGSTFDTDPTSPDGYSPPFTRPSTLPTNPTDTRYPSTAPGYSTTNMDEGPGTTYALNDNTADTSFATRPRPTSNYPTTQYGIYDQSTYTNGDRITYSDGNPLYPNPTLYDFPTNRPSSYAQNIPTVDGRYNPYGTVSQRVTTPKPSIGSGYGNGYSYGTPDPNRNRRPGDKPDLYPPPPTADFYTGGNDRDRYPSSRPDPNVTPDKRRPGYNSPTNNMGNENTYNIRPDPYPERPSYNDGFPTRNGYDQRRDPERRPMDDRGRPGYGNDNNMPNAYGNRPVYDNDFNLRPRPSYEPPMNGYRPTDPSNNNRIQTTTRRPYQDTRPTQTNNNNSTIIQENGYLNRPDPNYNDRPSSGNGYNDRPSNDNNKPGQKYNDKPTQGNGYNDRPTNGNGYKDRPSNGNGYNDRPSNGNGYNDRPSNGNGYNDRPTNVNGYSDRPMNGNGNNNQPTPTNGYNNGGLISTKPTSGYEGNSNAYRPHENRTRPGYPKPNSSHDYVARPEGKYNDSNDHTIETYFNPDEYFQTLWTIKPSGYGERHDIGYYDSDYNTQMHNMEHNGACFRRVLAGKRIASHWVRRTLACERVEDCMQECGHEKRFQCEGFNYRLDPSGHGQGDCELIEIPLAQMDLYSSTQHRDANLLRHPDYDYYERDRNAPSRCRTGCKECGSGKPISSQAIYFRPGSHERPSPSSYDKYSPPSSSGSYGPPLPPPDHYSRPPSTAVDRYRPTSYESRPDEYHRYDFSSHGYHESSGGGSYYRPPSSPGYGGDRIDRYDDVKPSAEAYRPSHWETIPSSHGSSSYGGDFYSRPIDHGKPILPPYDRPDNDRPDNYRPPYRPGPDYSPYRNPPHPPPLTRPDDRYIPPSSPPSSHSYLDRDRNIDYKKPPKFIPYLIGSEKDYGAYGVHNKNADYWGVNNENRRKDGPDFNYFELGGRHPSHVSDNSIYTYPGSKYHEKLKPDYDYGSQWTRRAGPDECSVKSCEGFRLHKAAIRHSLNVPSITECEKLCFSEDKFNCHTYSFRYSNVGRDNCLLCDRPVNHLDYYVDLEPDRDYDIYSMSDEHKSCRAPIPPPVTVPPHGPPSTSTALSDPRNNQCFFRAIDATRFFKTIVRDSLTVRSIGECELECIKSSKFTCRAFAFRYGQGGRDSIIDNCQLSDWPVRDMDKGRHLKLDPSFDVFERASYGHGCEIQPIVDEKHKKLCYLGYGSAAKLLAPAIKKVISVPTELECKKECIRYRENTSFKCFSFSFGSHASSFNCEMSDLDQSELKLDIHYQHTPDRDYWLFAWNPFDWTCRDKVTTIGGNRVNNDRRMDIFREPGDVTWRHYTVSGKPCRIGSGCDKNLVTGFYSCEIDGGEIGSWDYCCKAEHPCGYSKGFDYPWCFVGDEADQWRKCSDRYFPGNLTHAGITLQTTSKDKIKKPYLPTESSNINDHPEQRPPRPGGLQSLSDFTAARLWPVTYLYSEGPPNSTELSNFVDCNKETC